MAAAVITTDDLREFKQELLNEIEQLLKQYAGQLRKKYLRSGDVRRLLGISAGSLQNLRVSGKLPYTKIGGTIIYDYQDILRMIADNGSPRQRARHR